MTIIVDVGEDVVGALDVVPYSRMIANRSYAGIGAVIA